METFKVRIPDVVNFYQARTMSVDTGRSDDAGGQSGCLPGEACGPRNEWEQKQFLDEHGKRNLERSTHLGCVNRPAVGGCILLTRV